MRNLRIGLGKLSNGMALTHLNLKEIEAVRTLAGFDCLLTTTEWDIWRSRLNAKPYRVIAEKHSLSLSRVGEIFKKSVRRLKFHASRMNASDDLRGYALAFLAKRYLDSKSSSQEIADLHRISVEEFEQALQKLETDLSDRQRAFKESLKSFDADSLIGSTNVRNGIKGSLTDD